MAAEVFRWGDVKYLDGRTIYCSCRREDKEAGERAVNRLATKSRIKKVVQCGGLPVVLPLYVQNSVTRGKNINITANGNPRAISGPFTL
jgi:hypothetical protein